MSEKTTKAYQIRCWYCHKPVTNIIPAGIVFRAITVCPECLVSTAEADNLFIVKDVK